MVILNTVGRARTPARVSSSLTRSKTTPARY